MRRPWWSLLAASLLACGARTGLEDGELALGGSGGGAASTSTSTGAGGAGGAVACDALVLLDPVQLETPSPVARAPEIGTLVNDVDAYLALIEAPRGQTGLLRVGRLIAFSQWPPVFTAMVELDTGVLDFITGPGPLGVPTALLDRGGPAGSFLATQLLTTIQGVPFSMTGDEYLFVAGIDGRYLAAGRLTTPDYSLLHVGSYQPASRSQTTGGLTCLTSPVLAAALPAGNGFVAAFVTDAAEPSCDRKNPGSGGIITFARYDSPSEPGSMLELVIGDHLVFDDTVVHLALAPSSFGAWAVYQAAGNNARVQPPISALQIDGQGVALAQPPPITAVSPEGVSTPRIALTTIGDRLVVAWIDNVDPSSPTIIVQVVEADGTLGPQASVPTAVVWLTGRLRMTTSNDQRSVLLAWEGGLDEPQIGLARLDCVGGL